MLETDRRAHCNGNPVGLDAHVEYVAGHLFESALLRKIEEHLLSKMDRILPLDLKYNQGQVPAFWGQANLSAWVQNCECSRFNRINTDC